MRLALLCLAVLVLTGCARFEYDLVDPAEFAQRVARDEDVRFEHGPLEYRLRTVDNRLVMRVYNISDDSVQLLGDRSTVVAPTGQSHPLMSRTIAPYSYIRLILPPMRPRADRVGPSVGFGVGVGRAAGPGRVGVGAGAARPIGGPQYLGVADPDFYWEWRGETSARLILVYRVGEETIQHQFVFQRRRV